MFYIFFCFKRMWITLDHWIEIYLGLRITSLSSQDLVKERQRAMAMPEPVLTSCLQLSRLSSVVGSVESMQLWQAPGYNGPRYTKAFGKASHLKDWCGTRCVRRQTSTMPGCKGQAACGSEREITSDRSCKADAIPTNRRSASKEGGQRTILDEDYNEDGQFIFKSWYFLICLHCDVWDVMAWGRLSPGSGCHCTAEVGADHEPNPGGWDGEAPERS